MNKHKNAKEGIISILFIFSVFFLPFTFALNPNDNIDLSIVRILIPSLFLIWLGVSLFKKKLFIDTRFRFWALIGLVFLSFVSILWSEEPYWAFRKSLFLASILPIYFISFSYFKNKSKFNKFSKALCFSALLVALLGIVQFFSQFFFDLNSILSFHQKITPFFLGNNFAKEVAEYNSWLVNIKGQTILRSFAVFPDPHLFSIFLNLSLPFILYNYLKTKQKRYLIIIFLVLLGVFLSFSRAGYLAVFVLFVISIFFFKPFKKNFLVFLFSLLVFLSLLGVFHQRFLSAFNLQEGSVSGRLEMLEKSWQVFKENPLKGTGIGNLPAVLDSNNDYRKPVYAHNLFLDFASELGVIGLTFLSITILAPMIVIFKKPGLKRKIIALSILALLIHSMFETPFYSVRVFPLILIILSI
ncbi:MAG: O-antigen ligase family protein [Candidatus Moraniibacteriota bacterium]